MKRKEHLGIKGEIKPNTYVSGKYSIFVEFTLYCNECDKKINIPVLFPKKLNSPLKKSNITCYCGKTINFTGKITQHPSTLEFEYWLVLI